MQHLPFGRALLAALTLAVAWQPALAVTGGEADEAASLSPQEFVQSLHFQDGHIEVAQAKAHFDLDPKFRYLGQADAQRVLENFWGNPPDSSVLGLVVPREPALDQSGSWAVVVTYSDDGYVSDEDASKIDYTKLLADMRQGTAEANEERHKQGYPKVDLVGWAVPPRYDGASKKLYWAKDLAFEGESEHTLNYDIRVLGRQGYLSLNAVAGMAQLPQVREGMQQLLPMTGFDDGARYADHNPSTDKIAGYGVAALIGGGLAAKAGLFAKLGLLLAKFWKLLAIGVVAFGASLKKLFTRKAQGTVR